jgi:hypothetical protein
MTPLGRLAAGALLFQAVTGGARDTPSATRPLPDQQPFFTAIRDNLARSQDAQKSFSYKERRTDLDLNPFGHVGMGETRVIEVVPTGDGSTYTRRLIERDGKAVTTSMPTVRHVNASARGKAIVDDVAGALDVRIDHREEVDGRDMIVLAFTPLGSAKPRTREGKLVKNFKGRIWIDEEAREVTRVEAVAIDNINVGLGVIGWLNDGATATVQRQRIDGDIWLPTSIRFNGEGRELLFRKLVLDFAVDWFDYRRIP